MANATTAESGDHKGTPLQVVDLTIGYGRRVVAAGINLALERGMLTCLIGSNGVGKSTLLRTLCAFQPPITGMITIDVGGCRGVTLSPQRAGDHKGTPLHPRRMAKLIGVVLTERIDSVNITAEEVVALGRSPYTDFRGRLTDNDRRIISESMTMIGIEHLRSHKMHRLSDGERQKVMIAKTLAQQTPIILLDEPTAFLDYPSKVETMQLLHRLCHEAGKTILLSTHDIDIAIPVIDRLWHMTGEEVIVVKNTRHIRNYLENALPLQITNSKINSR